MAEAKTSDLIPDNQNTNKHTQRGHGMTRRSVDKFGPRKPLELDKDGRLIDGNDRQEIYVDIGLEELEIIDAEPGKVYAVRYPDADLSDPDNWAREYQVAQARAGQLNLDLDMDAILGHMAEGVDFDDWFLDFEFEELGLGGDDDLILPDKQPNPRNLPIDVIYTLQGADATCCLAVRAGLKYGIQSKSYTLCPYCVRGDEAHKVVFVDNDYFNYDHEKHLSVVRELKPKYATVRDVMTKAQCRKEDIEWYSLEKILEWAEELNQWAENVIVIPKYDCLDKIPDTFMLGYSVPTSHGGTPLPIDLFKGRRVHLLGGSWKKQLHYLAALGDDIVSLDNNYILKQARFANFCVPDGDTKQLADVGLSQIINPRYVAVALSFGAIGAKVNELYGSSGNE